MSGITEQYRCHPDSHYPLNLLIFRSCEQLPLLPRRQTPGCKRIPQVTFNLQRSHLRKQLLDSSSTLNCGKTSSIRMVMTYDLITAPDHQTRNYCCSILLLLSMPTRTKRSEIIVNAQEIAASLVVPAACCINWSPSKARTASVAACIKLSPTSLRASKIQSKDVHPGSLTISDKLLILYCVNRPQVKLNSVGF